MCRPLTALFQSYRSKPPSVRDLGDERLRMLPQKTCDPWECLDEDLSIPPDAVTVVSHCQAETYGHINQTEDGMDSRVVSQERLSG